MPEYQPVSSVYLSAIERPGCPACNRNRMLLSKLDAGPPGFDHRATGTLMDSLSVDAAEAAARQLWRRAESAAA